AFLFPSSARDRILFLLTDTTAISAPAKKAFNSVKNTKSNRSNKIESPAGSASIKIFLLKTNYYQEKYIMCLPFSQDQLPGAKSLSEKLLHAKTDRRNVAPACP